MGNIYVISNMSTGTNQCLPFLVADMDLALIKEINNSWYFDLIIWIDLVFGDEFDFFYFLFGLLIF